MINHDNLVDLAAELAHEMNRIYCLMLGDESQAPWKDAPTWQKDSVRAGVEVVMSGATPDESHQAWLDYKTKDGWVYGPVKNPVTKEHPCMKPFDELPQEQRLKDHLFGTVVRAVVRVLTEQEE